MRLFLVIFAVEALAASWIEIFAIDDFTLERIVEALAASWIEIHWDIKCAGMQDRRSPCGFVD